MSYKKLGDIAHVRRGASPRPIDDPKYFGGEVGWVRISDVSASGKYLRKTTQYVSALGESMSVRVDRGDLIMSIAATVGKPIIVDMPACIHDGFVHIYNLRGITSEFLYYSLSYLEKSIIGLGQAGTQVNINSEIVRGILLYVPSIVEQTRITGLLSDLDTLITRTESLIAHYERIRGGLLYDLLTRGIDEHGRLRSEETHEFKDSSIGRVPIEWDARNLGSFLTAINGRAFKPTEWAPEGKPIIRIENLNNESNPFNYCDFEVQKRYHINKGDILISWSGTPGTSFGVFVWQREEAVLNQHIFKIILNESLVDKRYFVHAYDSIIRKMVNESQGSGGLQHIKKGEFLAMLIPFPNQLEEQRNIANCLDAHDMLVKNNRQHLNKLRRMKAGLMHDLLTPPQVADTPVLQAAEALSA